MVDPIRLRRLDYSFRWRSSAGSCRDFSGGYASYAQDFVFAGDYLAAGYMLLSVLVLVTLASFALRKPLKSIVSSIPALLVIFALTLVAQLLANIPAVKEFGFESVFFAVILGLVISNFLKVPQWMKPAVNSEFYIKIGIICLGSTILSVMS